MPIPFLNMLIGILKVGISPSFSMRFDPFQNSELLRIFDKQREIPERPNHLIQEK